MTRRRGDRSASGVGSEHPGWTDSVSVIVFCCGLVLGFHRARLAWPVLGLGAAGRGGGHAPAGTEVKDHANDVVWGYPYDGGYFSAVGISPRYFASPTPTHGVSNSPMLSNPLSFNFTIDQRSVGLHNHVLLRVASYPLQE
jgi:hypothetical protein